MCPLEVLFCSPLLLLGVSPCSFFFGWILHCDGRMKSYGDPPDRTPRLVIRVNFWSDPFRLFGERVVRMCGSRASEHTTVGGFYLDTPLWDRLSQDPALPKGSLVPLVGCFRLIGGRPLGPLLFDLSC